jgi:5-methylcytosine-specific restriction endonuclease McrA
MEPIPEVYIAAKLLEAAVDRHLKEDFSSAAELFSAADLSIVGNWAQSFWDKRWRSVVRPNVPGLPAGLPLNLRHIERMPNKLTQKKLFERDGYHCRFCGMPVIPAEVRRAATKHYPDIVRWGRASSEQHTAFQAMLAHFDHVVPHSRGGDSSPENMVISCAPCNYGKANFLLEELDLLDPRVRKPHSSDWDGLKRLISSRADQNG